MSNETTAETEAAAVIAVTREAHAGELRPLDPKVSPLLSVTVPNGYTRETVDLREYLPAPDRAVGTVTTQTVQSFSAYVKRHDDTSASTVWVDADRGLLVAVLDDHIGTIGDIEASPGWREHRATLALKPTDEWTHWTTWSGKLMDQEAFAEHVEDGETEIVKPEAAELKEIAMSMQGHTNAEWKSAKRLHDGSVQFIYSEDATATAGGKGELEIPQTFELLIRPFRGEEPVAMTARLRYRVKSGNLSIGYKLDRPNDVKSDAIDLITARLAEQFGADRVFTGSPG
jgi:uncharacterized protein YfdQ (DUF2303 family)